MNLLRAVTIRNRSQMVFKLNSSIKEFPDRNSRNVPGRNVLVLTVTVCNLRMGLAH